MFSSQSNLTRVGMVSWAVVVATTTALEPDFTLRLGEQAHAQATAICSIATRVVRSAYKTCGSQILTDPVGCMKRVWEENRGFVEGAAAAAKEGFKWLVEKGREIKRYFDQLADSIMKEAGIKPGQSIVSQVGSVAMTILRRGVGVLEAMNKAVERLVRKAVAALATIARKAAKQLAGAPEYKAMVRACGDRGNGAIALFNKAVRTCTSAIANFSLLRPGPVKDCVSAAWDAGNAAVARCIPTANTFVAGIPSVIGRMAKETATKVKSAVSRRRIGIIGRWRRKLSAG